MTAARRLPPAVLIPLLVVLDLVFVCHDSFAPIIALAGDVAAIALVNFKYFHNPNHAIGGAITGALVAICNTAGGGGLGTVTR